MDESVAKCILCDSPQLTDWDKEFVECISCGLIFRRFMPSEPELNELYSQCYSPRNIQSGTTHMESGVIPLRNHARFLRPRLPWGARVLDYGSGTGEFARILMDMGYLVDGCEISHAAAQEARHKYGVSVAASLGAFSENTYDAVTAIEVIEHLRSPWATLVQLETLLRPGGLLYLTTPNVSGLHARLQRGHWKEACKPGHLMLFRFLSLSRVLREAGYEDITEVRFSPLTCASWGSVLRHRVLQTFGLYGGLRVLARRRRVPDLSPPEPRRNGAVHR